MPGIRDEEDDRCKTYYYGKDHPKWYWPVIIGSIVLVVLLLLLGIWLWVRHNHHKQAMTTGYQQ